MSVSVKHVNLPKRKSMKSVSSLENIGPAFVLYFGDATFCKHVITHIAEDLELFNTGETRIFSGLTNNFEKICFEHDQHIAGE